MTVAVVEDDRQLLEALQLYLVGRGLRVKGYGSCREINANSLVGVEVLLLDVHLPDGDGASLINGIKTDYPAIKIIVMSGYDSLPLRLRSFCHGADDYLKKPVFPAELYERVVRFARPTISGKQSVDSRRYTARECGILTILLDAKGGVVPLHIFLATCCLSESAFYTSLSRIKRKSEGEYIIHSVYGRGWYLEVL